MHVSLVVNVNDYSLYTSPLDKNGSMEPPKKFNGMNVRIFLFF